MSIKLLEEKMDVKLHHLEFVSDFFHMLPKAKEAREK